jgi:hypothetical protein
MGVHEREKEVLAVAYCAGVAPSRNVDHLHSLLTKRTKPRMLQSATLAD